jgi:hypothetical protein
LIIRRVVFFIGRKENHQSLLRVGRRGLDATASHSCSTSRGGLEKLSNWQWTVACRFELWSVTGCTILRKVSVRQVPSSRNGFQGQLIWSVIGRSFQVQDCKTCSACCLGVGPVNDQLNGGPRDPNSWRLRGAVDRSDSEGWSQPMDTALKRVGSRVFRPTQNQEMLPKPDRVFKRVT